MMKKGNGEINTDVLFLKIQKREKKVTVPKYLHTRPTEILKLSYISILPFEVSNFFKGLFKSLHFKMSLLRHV